MRCLLFFMLTLSALSARAGSYNYRDDIFAWESAANAIRDQDWNGTCTSHPGDEDRTTLNFSNGFVFPFNGSNYASVRVFINGMVQFGPDAGAQRSNSNTALPMAAPVSMAGCTSSVPSGMLLVYWSDMQVQASPVLGLGAGTVSWEQKGSAPNRYVVISWTNVYKPSFLGALFATRYSFQVILYESGQFKYQYTTASSLLGTSFNADGSDATIGVQVNGGDTTQYAYRQAFNSAGSALRWFPGDQVRAPIATYSFDENSYDGSAGEVKDSSGNSNNATRVGNASSDALGQSCRSLLVPASSGSAAAGADTSINVASAVGNDGSIDFYYRSSVAWNNATAMLLDATGSSSRPFYVMLNNGVIKFVATDGSNTVQSVSSPAQSVAANTWVHIAVSWRFISGSTANVLNLWINGSLVAVSSVASTTGTINNSLGALRIGDARGPTAPSGGTLNSANGRIDELHLYNYVIGSSEVNQDLNASHACAALLHHLLISGTSNAGAACAPSTFTIKACTDAACSSLATSGVSGTLSSSNAATLWPMGSSFAIPVGSGSVGFSVQLPVPGSTTLGANATTPVAQTDTSCDFDPACQYSSTKAALLLSVPNHVAGSTGVRLSISAVSSAPNTNLCVPAFSNVSRSVRLQCGYTNPPSGTVAPNVGGISNCVTSPMVSVAFNASGIATLPFSYADVGQLAFAASYSGNAANQDQGLAMSGTTSVITAPASFSVDNFSSPLVAGKPFSASITALNANGTKTPNFMRETVPAKPSLSFTRTSPTGNGVSNGVFSGGVGGVSGGVVSVSNAVWTEVGQGTLTAAINNYLGTGMNASGVSAATPTFIPHHFDVTVAPACSTFSYSGQPFTATVTARNGLTNPTTTSNYDGSGILTPAYAQAGTYSAAQAIGAGSFTPASVPANAFRHGVATVNALGYAFSAKLTAPGSLYVRVTDANGVSSASGSETSVMLRSGRLQISSNSGSEKNALDLPVQAQYWTGAAWVLNRDDSCTVVPNQAIVLFNPLTLKGVTSTDLNNSATFTLTNGVRKLTLSPASPAAKGSLDVGINLGTPSNAQLCSTAAVPTSVGAQLPWLRSQNGSVGHCGAAWDRDPAARATFGVVGAETGKLIDVRIPF